MKTHTTKKLKDGDRCQVISGTHSGKSGIVQDIHTSKTGHITITILQANGIKFKTLAKNVSLQLSRTTAKVTIMRSTSTS